MFSLNLPKYAIKMERKGDKVQIWDIIRQKYLILTPEEWVRQHFIHYLIEHKGYPIALLANEVTLKLNGTTKRCDTVLYTSTLVPRMIIEYKAPQIPITQSVFDQIRRYNLTFKVDYLIVSNGLKHYCCQMDYEKKTYIFLKEIPNYKELFIKDTI